MAIKAEPRSGCYREGLNWTEDQYIVTGTSNRVQARNAIPGEQYIAFPHPTRPGEEITLQKTITGLEFVIDHDEPDSDLWYVTVRYEEVDDDLAEVNLSLSIGMGTVNVKEFLDDPEVHAAAGMRVPSFGRAIGVVKTDNGYENEGVDIHVPNVTLEVERRYTRRAWNAKTAQLIHKAGMVNSDAVTIVARGPAGDVVQRFGEEELLLGDVSARPGERYMTVAYKLLVSPTESVAVPGIAGPPENGGVIVKQGWRYHWNYLMERMKENGMKEKFPALATIGRTYYRTTFGNMLTD